MRREMELFFFKRNRGLFSSVLDFTFNIVLFTLPWLAFLSPKGRFVSFLSVVFANERREFVAAKASSLLLGSVERHEKTGRQAGLKWLERELKGISRGAINGRGMDT